MGLKVDYVKAKNVLNVPKLILYEYQKVLMIVQKNC